jgi:hypothetical protein
MTCRSTMNHSTKKKPQISPLRCAPVEMTNLLQGHVLVSKRQRRQSFNKLVSSPAPACHGTGGSMEQWAAQCDEGRLLSGNCFPSKRYPILCHPERSRPVPARRGGICSFRGPLLETRNLVPTKICHLDRSAAEWRDLRFPFRCSRRHQSPHTRNLVWHG